MPCPYISPLPNVVTLLVRLRHDLSVEQLEAGSVHHVGGANQPRLFVVSKEFGRGGAEVGVAGIERPDNLALEPNLHLNGCAAGAAKACRQLGEISRHRRLF